MKYDHTENMSHIDWSRYDNLTFDSYRKLASESGLNCYDRIGSPKEYREGKEEVFFQDILLKLTNLKKNNLKVLDIGPGCTPLTTKIIDFCLGNNHNLFLIDSAEMLSLIPSDKAVTKILGRFPNVIIDQLQRYSEYFDVILCYDVFHIAFVDSNPYYFIDARFKNVSP